MKLKCEHCEFVRRKIQWFIDSGPGKIEGSLGYTKWYLQNTIDGVDIDYDSDDAYDAYLRFKAVQNWSQNDT